jgi:hypothetical protein
MAMIFGNFYRLDKFLLLRSCCHWLSFHLELFNLIDANTEFSVISDGSSNGELIIKAYSHPPFDSFKNIMNFSTGELTFHSHYKNKDTNRRSGLNATKVTAYQYLGMTKIAGALNMLPKTPYAFLFLQSVYRKPQFLLHKSCEFEPHSWRGVLDTPFCYKVCQ